MGEKRCTSKCNSYISPTECNFDFESTILIKEGDLCHNLYSEEEITKDRVNGGFYNPKNEILEEKIKEDAPFVGRKLRNRIMSQGRGYSKTTPPTSLVFQVLFQKYYQYISL